MADIPRELRVSHEHTQKETEQIIPTLENFYNFLHAGNPENKR